MTATITEHAGKGTISGKWRDKELIRAYHVLDSENVGAAGEPLAFIDCRLYMARSSVASVVYCLIWAHGIEGPWYEGHGSAGGCGYDKASAAVASALDNAGIIISRDIGGVGSGAICDALLAVARALGAARPFIVESYA